MSIIRDPFRVCLLFLAYGFGLNVAQAEDLFLADGLAFPGQLWLSRDGAVEQSIHRRQAEPNPAFPHAIMKLAQVAIGPDGARFYCSGLDGSVMHLLDWRHEIQSFEFDGQVRDLACTGEQHTVYFSVVPTPQNGAPLQDGKIYRRDLWDGRATEIATIHQPDVGGNWWGTFAIRNGVIYLATLEGRSRLFKLTSSGPQAVFPENVFQIQGLAVGPDSSFYFATGSDKAYRTGDFVHIETAFRADRSLTDVALQASPDSPGP